ncbi:MAG: CRISPR-associated DxTHG motif protein [Muribaculaceae bacterium]|nr:CRISPR-associated DxTHG motif protein [Muribaculaceae bacterium]
MDITHSFNMLLVTY